MIIGYCEDEEVDYEVDYEADYEEDNVKMGR